MTRKCFEKSGRGTAEWVLGHGAWMKSQGKNPSEPYLTERNPRKALQKAKLMSVIMNSQKETRNLISEFGGVVAAHKQADDMTDDEAVIALRHIAVTSTSKEEVEQRAEKVGFSCVSVNILSALSAIGREARELCLAMGGATLKDGETLIQIMALGVPSGNCIMV